MILEGKMIEPAIDRMVEFIMNFALIFTAISLGAATLLALYYLRSCLKRLCWHGEADMASQHSNSDTKLGLIMNGMNQVSIPSAQPEHDQHSSGDYDTDGIVIIMKGVHDTDHVSVFIMKGAHDTD